MKKIIVLILCIALAGCSAIPPELLSTLYTPTSPPPTKVVTPTRTPTITPTRPTPTFTYTPTLSGVTPSATEPPTPTIDLTATVTVTAASPTATRIASETPTPPGKYFGFASVFYSPSEIFWGDCEPTETTFTTTVQNVNEVASVWLFVKLLDRQSKTATDWNVPIVMVDQGGGTYSIVLKSKNIVDYSNFTNAWIVYQLVAANEHGDPIGRTQIFGNGLTLTKCRQSP